MTRCYSNNTGSV